MMERIKLVLMVLNLVRVWPSLLLVALAGSNSLIAADIRRWTKILYHEDVAGLRRILYRHVYFMCFYREYRNLAYVRLPLALAYRWMMPRLPSLHILMRDIGPGFFIQHGFSTVISATRVGANFWLNQQVTIGYSNDTDKPTIGDDVTVRPGAKVVGKLTIGDGATVGMNTVVTGNVPAGATVFGVPGQVIWRNKR